MDIAKMQKQLVLHEGIRLRPYRDSVGKLTIGCGRNLDDKGITEEEAYQLLANDIHSVRADLDSHLPWWTRLDDARQRVLVDMCFNVGVFGLLRFTRMISALGKDDFRTAAAEMLDSQWARQVGGRADTLARMMIEGT